MPSYLVKNLNTLPSLSKNYFWEATLPPPRDFSKNSFISASFTVGGFIDIYENESYGTSNLSAYG